MTEVARDGGCLFEEPDLRCSLTPNGLDVPVGQRGGARTETEINTSLLRIVGDVAILLVAKPNKDLRGCKFLHSRLAHRFLHRVEPGSCGGPPGYFCP